MKRTFMLLLLSIFLMGIYGAIGVEYPLSFTDAAARNITLDSPVDGIIVMNGDALEAVAMIGTADKIIGLSDSALKKRYLAPDLKTKQVVGKWNEPDYEMIGELARDGQKIALITYGYPDKPYGAAAFADKLKDFPNVVVVALDFYKPDTIISDIATLGNILGKEAEADEYVNWYNEKRSSVEQAVSGMTKPKVYAEWNTKGDLSTLGNGSGFDGVLQLANAFNIARNVEGEYPKIGWEWVITQKPEVIIKRQTQPTDKTEMGWKPAPSQDSVALESVINEILGRAGASGLPAAKSNKIYIIDWDVMNGLDQVVGLTYLAKLLHPEADLNPEEVHKEYLQHLGLEYPGGRIFVYPELN
jgi:iron complex transport system substrate-binding protein